MSRIVNILAGISWTALAAGVAYAQDAPEEPEQPSGDERIVLDAVTVTATKREESLQDVSISVTAITSQSLSETGTFDTKQLQDSVAGLTYTQSANIGVPVIRGVGGSNLSIGSESSVATYVDGVYRPIRTGGIFALNNIEQIEVLRGPQGALFGRNAAGGVIQVITRTPSKEPMADINVGYASFDKVTTNLYASTGLGENAAIDFAAHHTNQGEGWGENADTGAKANYSRETSFRSKLQVEASEDTVVTASVDYNKRFEDTPYRGLPGTVTLDGLMPPADFYDARYSERTYGENEQWGGSLTIEHDLGWSELKSISGYQELDGYITVDNDATALPLIVANIGTAGNAFTQEVQLTSSSDSAVEWIVGGFYMDADQTADPFYLSGLIFAGAGDFFVTTGTQNTKSYAVFGQVGIDLTDKFKLIGGLRYTQDEQEVVYDRDSGLGPLGSGSQSESFDDVTPRIVLEYSPNSDVLLYASYNGGFKSGAFSATSPTNPAVKPEKLEAFEVGAKLEFMDGRARLNGATYYYDYSDLQIFVVNVVGELVNLDAEIYGMDADLEIAVTDRFTFKGGLALIEAEQTVGVTSGNAVPRSPSYQIIVGGNYDIADNLWLTANLSITDSYFWDIPNLLEADSRQMLSASLNWESETSGLYGSIWGKNLLDEEYFNSAANAGFGAIGQPGEPLTAGVTVGVRF